jgi:hypothetical protein
MSRVVPLDQALSVEDRRYLRGLGAHGTDTEKRIDEAFTPDPDELAEFERDEREAAAKLNGVGLNQTDQDNLVEENARLRAELAALRGDVPPPANDYSAFTKVQLEDEIDRVNREDPAAKLAKGTKAEMLTALEEYFKE